jgi:DNA gyrase subunit A
VPLANVLTLETDEVVAGLAAVPDFKTGGFLTLCTAQGRIKRTAIEEFAAVRAGGLTAITLDSGDELRFVRVTPGGQELILVTAQGQALRFGEDEVRAMGRTAGGVNAIKLEPKDELVGMDVVDSDAALVVVTGKGYAKQTPLTEYPTQGRYGKGIATFAAKALAQTGPLAGACVARADDEVGIVSTAGMAVRLKVSDIPAQSRSTRGAAVVQLKSTDKVIGVAHLAAKPQTRTATVQEAKGTKKRATARRPAAKKPSVKPAGRSSAKARKEPAAKAPVASGKAAAKKRKRPGKG